MTRSLMCGAGVLLALLSGCDQQPAQQPADLVILGGDIQTMAALDAERWLSHSHGAATAEAAA